MNKLYVILLAMMLVLVSCTFLVSAPGESEDQKQEEYNDSNIIYGEPACCYQQFVPSLPKLTKIKVLLEKPGGAVTSYDKYYLAIKKTWSSQPETLTYIEGNQVQSTTPVWYEFDFPDIEVEKGTTYGIEMYGVDYNPACAAVRWCHTDHDAYGFGAGFIDDDGDDGFNYLTGHGDFAFITIGTSKKTKSNDDNYLFNPLFRFLSNHPCLFPLLQQILKLK